MRTTTHGPGEMLFIINDNTVNGVYIVSRRSRRALDYDRVVPELTDIADNYHLAQQADIILARGPNGKLYVLKDRYA